MELNVTQEEQRVDIEEMRDSLRLAVLQYAQAIPTLAAQGQDPSEVVTRIAEVIQGRQKGLAIESIVEKVFAPAPAPQIPAAGMTPASASQPTPEMMAGAAPAAGPMPQQSGLRQRVDIASLLQQIAG